MVYWRTLGFHPRGLIFFNNYGLGAALRSCLSVELLTRREVSINPKWSLGLVSVYVYGVGVFVERLVK